VDSVKTIFHIEVGTPVTDALARAGARMEALEQGRTPEPWYGIGFENMPQMLGVFTQRRWELIQYLREHGPMRIVDLARHLKRDYKNVHGDIAALVEWQVVWRDDRQQVYVPWDEIDLRLPLQRKAA